METKIDLKKAKQENLRWQILAVCNAGRPVGVSENLILTTVQAIIPDATILWIRQEMDYLEDRGLVDIEGKGTPIWRAELTHHGVDVVEYTVNCYPGIARPEKYW